MFYSTLLIGVRWTSCVKIGASGRIGLAVAKRATGFGMSILYFNRSRNIPGEEATGAVRVEIDELYARSDYIVLVRRIAPHTPTS